VAGPWSVRYPTGAAVTPDDLVTLREIEHLKYRYLRALDLKDWDAFADVFEPEATGWYGEGLRFGSAAEIVSFMRDSLGPDIITVHQVHQPEIALAESGAFATGTWMLMDRVIAVAHRVVVEGAAVYRDEYRRGPDGRWRICNTGYERIYESTMALADWPSWKLTANRFGVPAG
jgi:ketosteroid isomerase-like protein